MTGLEGVLENFWRFLKNIMPGRRFFMLGGNLEGRGDIVRRMKDIGCELGNHSYNHASLDGLDVSGIEYQIRTTDDLLRQICGEGASLVRPPYGAWNDTLSGCVGAPMILWDIDTLDWQTRMFRRRWTV